MLYPHNFTFPERENQLALAAELLMSSYESDAYFKDLSVLCFNEYIRKGRHWDITKFKKKQIKEDLLCLFLTHISKYLRDFTHMC